MDAAPTRCVHCLQRCQHGCSCLQKKSMQEQLMIVVKILCFLALNAALMVYVFLLARYAQTYLGGSLVRPPAAYATACGRLSTQLCRCVHPVQ